jgi:hypothetical protein
MDRGTQSTLHRQRTIYSEDLMVDQGTAEEMIKRVMDQPKGMRLQYTIMQGQVVYQPTRLKLLLRSSGLLTYP